jgi:hypothetical protein
MQSFTIDIDDDMVQAITRIADTQNMTTEQVVPYLLDRTLFGITRRLLVPIQDYKPQSVMVMIDETEDDLLKHFRCENCGNIVFDYCGASKLIVPGRYDRDTMLLDGQNVAVSSFGQPTRIECQGRLLAQLPDGRTSKIRCAYKYYKLGA